MSRRSRASKVIATGVSVSATLAGVGLIAHADDTPSSDDTSAPAPSAVPVAATTRGTTAEPSQMPDGTTTVVTATTVLDRPGPAMLPTKSTEPALAVPVPSFDTVTTVTTVTTATTAAPLSIAPAPALGAPVTTAARPTVTTLAAPAPVAATVPATVAPPPETTAVPLPPPPPPPVTTTPPPPATLPPLTAPPDDTSRGTT